MNKTTLSLAILLSLLCNPAMCYAGKTAQTVAGCFLSFGFHCVAKYYFIAQNTRNCDLYSGLVAHNLMIGGAKTRFFSPNGSECKGRALPPYYQPDPRSHVGSEGKINAVCTDNRVIAGTWISDSLTTGHGSVSDNLGDNYTFTFGWTAKEAADGVNQLRSDLGCAPIQTNGVELRVEGKLLRTE